jgi:tetratricopeptide (TPR) repeat protein
MQKILSILFTLVVIPISLSAQLSYHSGDNLHFWGPIVINELENSPYTTWFAKNMQAYNPQPKKEDYYQNLIDTKVTIFLGTWCGDTKKYLPQFIKIWRSLGLPEENLHLIALHNEQELYKQGPEHEEELYNIHRVPTFIFTKDGKEIGRIVESPQTDFETDLAQIALGIPTTPKYSAVTFLQDLFQTMSMDSLKVQKNVVATSVTRKVSKISELTTFAKKLQTDGKLAEAELVLDLAILIYPYNPYVYYAKGLYSKNQNEVTKASDLFIKALRLEPNFEAAKKQLLDLN